MWCIKEEVQHLLVLAVHIDCLVGDFRNALVVASVAAAQSAAAPAPFHVAPAPWYYDVVGAVGVAFTGGSAAAPASFHVAPAPWSYDVVNAVGVASTGGSDLGPLAHTPLLLQTFQP